MKGYGIKTLQDNSDVGFTNGSTTAQVTAVRCGVILFPAPLSPPSPGMAGASEMIRESIERGGVRMRFLTASLIVLACLWPAGAGGETVKTTTDARLELTYVENHKGEPHVLLATVTNRGRRTIACMKHLDYLAIHGWKLTIAGPGGDYAVPPPPGPSVIPGPEHFVVVRPGESVTTMYGISSALCCGPGRKTPAALASTPGSYRAALTYSFSPGMLPGQGSLSTGGNSPGWQKLVREAFFVQSMESMPVRFTIRQAGAR